MYVKSSPDVISEFFKNTFNIPLAALYADLCMLHFKFAAIYQTKADNPF